MCSCTDALVRLNGGAQMELDDEQLSESPSDSSSDNREGFFLIRENNKFGFVILTIGTGICTKVWAFTGAKAGVLELEEGGVSGKIEIVSLGKIV